MQPIKSFLVKASLPEALEPLREIAYNMWWYWNVQAIKLFYRLERKLWEEKYHNPVEILGSISQKRLEKLADDEGFLVELNRVYQDFTNYMNGVSWYSRHNEDFPDANIAYFSFEFGLSESIPVYSGGLGVLAGDHLKSSSDLGVPLVGVGLLYQVGYFRQYLNNDGWQGEIYNDNDFYNMPLIPVTDTEGNEQIIELEFPNGMVKVKVWKIQIGRVPLFLLDTNLQENPKESRSITATLYGGDQEMRLKQEILLGIGGMRALHAMGINPSVCHMNEGHAGFLALERIRILMTEENLSFHEAFELSKSGNIFTTHTPVPAGHDLFASDMMAKYFQPFLRESRISMEEFMSLGRTNPKDPLEHFSMTVLAIKSSNRSNAVSKLHKQVSKSMLRNLWADFPVEEVPINSVTNGVHVPSWVSQDIVELFDHYLDPGWRSEPYFLENWSGINDIPNGELWRLHELRRERLITFARKRIQGQLRRRGASETEIQISSGLLNSKVLTIGFARRFATYKRADLIFRDIERLIRIVNNPEKQVQFIFAGKAHPRDNEGKAIIRRIIHFSRRPELRNHIVFLEDYDMNVARYMVQGVDVWLNNPRRPLEASGTSGMKAAANGALNLSVLDGWWDEAFTPDVGWAIGSGEVYDNPDYQDCIESDAIYDILEKDLVPLFYKIEADGIPRGWVDKVKKAMSMIVPVFNTDRMVTEYFQEYYKPSLLRFKALKADNAERARQLNIWKQKLRKNWADIKIRKIETDADGPFKVGDTMKVSAHIHLGHLSPQDVSVELYAGKIDTNGSLVDAEPFKMEYNDDGIGKDLVFEGILPFKKSGKLGFSIRILPSHPDLAASSEMMIVKWANR